MSIIWSKRFDSDVGSRAREASIEREGRGLDSSAKAKRAAIDGAEQIFAEFEALAT